MDTVSSHKEVKFYDFDLDLPGGKRWEKIFETFSPEEIDELRKHGRKVLQQVGTVTLSAVSMAVKMFPRENIMFLEEIEYIAKRSGMEFYEVLLLQLVYEANAMCTGAVFKLPATSSDEISADTANNPSITTSDDISVDVVSKKIDKYFFRTMDWDMLFLKKYTIGLRVLCEGKQITEAATWLGLVGFFTVTSIQHQYSASINFRRSSHGNLLNNMMRTVTGCYPVSYLLRMVANSFDLKESLKWMKETDLISPCYFIICDWEGDKDCVITRDADQLTSIRKSGSPSKSTCCPLLVQANCDISTKGELDKRNNILWSVERVEMFLDVLKTTKGDLGDFLKFPVLNPQTIYVYYMKNGERLNCST